VRTRQGEVIQLHVTDVERRSNIWLCFLQKTFPLLSRSHTVTKQLYITHRYPQKERECVRIINEVKSDFQMKIAYKKNQ
jgi:hypothetical protein